MPDIQQIPADEYIQPTKLATACVKAIMKIWDKMGKPRDLSTNAGWVVMDQVIKVWKAYYPHEVETFARDVAEDLSQERKLSELNTLYNPITYPLTLYQLLRATFPTENFKDKKMIKKMANRYPFLKTTNLRL